MGDVDGEEQEMGEQLEVEAVMEEEVHGVEQVGGVLEVMGDVDGEVQVEEVGGDGEDEGVEQNEVEPDVEIRSWNSSFESGSGDGNNSEGNVEVKVQSMSNDYSGPCSSVSSDSIFDVNVEGENDREGYGTFATFVLPKSMVDFKWEVGTYFAEKQDILDAIESYALDNGRNIKFVKNDKQRMRFKCVGAKGPWRLYCGYMKAIKTWQLRTMLDNHTCSREFNLKLIDAKWLSNKIQITIRENPTVKGVDIREKIQRKWNISISRCMTYKAKNIAIEQIDGSFKEQCKRLYDYAHKLLDKIPRSIVKLKVEDVGGEVLFKRFYVCLKACKYSFLSCRPIIGLDRAFLRGKYDGELLTAVGQDRNEQMLPIAYCVVEVENKDSWRWFLELLGLLHAIDELLPRVEQRFCVRHLYANFRKKFPGKNLKRLMWRAATATHPQTWEMEMRNIRAVNEDAYKHLIAIPPRYWSRSRFTKRAKCDTLVNNMSEGFNSVLVSTRSKPIITLLEEIRLYLMQRWAKNSWSDKKLFEVHHMFNNGDKFVVNIDDSSCTCRTWMMTRIPCCHSLAAMKFLNIDREQFIDSCYMKSIYEETYSSIIYPINGANMWNITPYPDVSPPHKSVLLGRPKRK
ncbi:uncharacterized protein LOC106755020 [Vigna radiata var. radiata]|uniref:Uncharacterized protein LOC106755020 n=1 Tax=Vigna radiata var. radiata TaxID=3916 RepID=A0A1S3TFQ5_VIGRR|nr:uncharacterized protein LOC106755020 [Vigna radiata var. radiata]